MAISKILYDGIGIDLTGDTVTASHLETGYTAHDSDGNIVTGTLVKGITPSGVKTVTENGTYDVSTFSQAVVNVSGGFQGWQCGTFTGNNTASQTISCEGTCNEVIIFNLSTEYPGTMQYFGYVSNWRGTELKNGIRSTGTGAAAANLSALFGNGSITLNSGYATAYFRGSYGYLCR